MGNVIRLVAPRRPHPRDGLRTCIRPFQKKMNEIDSESHADSDLSLAATALKAAAAELVTRLSELLNYLDEVDNVIDALEDSDIKQLLRRQSILNREALLDALTALTQGLTQVKDWVLHW